MRNGTCPSCGGTEVYAAENGLAVGEFPTAGLRPHVKVRAVRQTSVDLWAYVCATCGLVELRFHDEAALAFIRERWVRVPPG